MLVRTSILLSLLTAAAAFAASATPPTKPTAPPAAPSAPGATSGTAATGAAAAECGHEVDQCLVGTWEMTVDGALAYMRTKLKSTAVNVKSETGKTITLNADGTFSTGQARSTVTAESDKLKMKANSVSQASGRWSAAGGKVTYCATQMQHQSSTTMMIGGKKVVLPTKPVGPSAATHSYTCASDKLVQTIAVGKDSMTSEYKRIK